jgi:SAM-dependent methyltransferase
VAAGLLKAVMSASATPRLLEAGCGRRTQLDVGDVFTVGLDIAPGEIALNRRLGEAVVGDIQSYPLPAGSFDAAVCMNVLEHLAKPVDALDNMRQALRDDGVLLFSVPDLRSLKTWGVMFTPVWAHRRLWRRLYPNAAADHGPFPAVHHPGTSLAHLCSYAQRHGMTVQSIPYESEMQRRIRSMLHLTGWRWRAVSFAVRLVTLGYIGAVHSDAIVVMRH